MKEPLLVIDADPICYAVAFAAQDYAVVDENGNIHNVYATARDAKEAAVFPDDKVLPYPEHIDCVKHRVDEQMNFLLDEMQTNSYSAFLTGCKLHENFRYAANPSYKANRKNLVKPYHYDNVREYLVSAWNCQLSKNGIEADDELSIWGWDAYLNGHEDVIICSIDKDLDQVPGYHYRWPTHNKEGNYYWVSEEEAKKTFWISVLTGDTVDNIIGLYRVGPKKAEKMLEGCQTDLEYYEACKEQYIQHLSEKLGSAESAVELMHMNCKMLHLLRTEEDEWEPSIYV